VCDSINVKIYINLKYSSLEWQTVKSSCKKATARLILFSTSEYYITIKEWLLIASTDSIVRIRLYEDIPNLQQAVS